MFSIFTGGKQKKKVMIIDDDLQMLQMYKQTLNVNNDEFEVITVSTKEEFMRNLDKIDAVVSDYHMKETTDITFLKVLEVCDKFKKPLLLISGDIYPYYDYQLSKPVSVKTIRLNIESMLKRGYVPSKKKPPQKMAA